jgi:SAM-dependent methyltransferase
MGTEDEKDYFSGELIYGDDFDQEKINQWFKAEENGYAGLGYIDSETDFYPYHGMNMQYGWRHITSKNLRKVLGIGSAFASEFSVVHQKIEEITVVEPGKKFWRDSAFGKRLNYVMPMPSGEMKFADNTFDLVTAFGVLHHIPNVSFVISELVRVLKPCGHLLIREPIISMGNWNYDRPGLTKNERGIPANLLRKLLIAQGCELVAENFIGFSPLQKIAGKLNINNYWDSSLLRKLDWFLCKIFSWNSVYHRLTIFDRFAPSTGYWVVCKLNTATI